MTHCSVRGISLTSCSAFAFLTLALMFTFDKTSAASPVVAVQRLTQEGKVGQCQVAFVAKTSVLLKSEFIKQSGFFPRDSNRQPERLLLSDSVSVRGALSLSDDFSKLANQGPNHIDYYVEFTLKSDSKESGFHEYIQQQLEKDPRFKRIKEDKETIHYSVAAQTVDFGHGNGPQVVVPGYQIVFDGKRITLASDSFEYDPQKFPALTENAVKLLKQFSDSDGFVVLDIKAASGLIESGLRGCQKEAPPLVPYFEMLERMNWATVSVEMGDSALFTVEAECVQNRDAEDLTKMIDDLVTMAKENNQGLGPNVEMTSEILDTVKLTTRGREVKASIEITEKAAQQSRVAADETLLMNNQRQAAISFHNFESVYGGLPFHAREGQSDELSWRVRVLPFLDRMELYERFDLSQSWDSAKNLGIMETTPMPEIFGGINGVGETETKTNLCWVKSNVKTLADITNGTSNTICFVRSDKYVHWTENNDVTPADVMAQFKALKPGGYLMASFYDGSVRKIPAETDPEEFAKMLDPGKVD